MTFLIWLVAHIAGGVVAGVILGNLWCWFRDWQKRGL